jgi:hypothetical protein
MATKIRGSLVRSLMTEAWETAPKVAEMYGISLGALKQWVIRGKVRSVKRGSSRLVNIGDVLKLVMR